VTDSGEVRNFDWTPGASVSIAERGLTEEVAHYLNLVASSQARDLRRMTISTVVTSVSARCVIEKDN